jgi:hypothetical protein
MLVDGPIFMFKVIITAVSALQQKLLKSDFDNVNKIMSAFNSNDRKVTVSKKDKTIIGIEELISRANAISITLPDLTASSVVANQ